MLHFLVLCKRAKRGSGKTSDCFDCVPVFSFRDEIDTEAKTKWKSTLRQLESQHTTRDT